MKKKIQALCASLFMGILLFMAGVKHLRSHLIHLSFLIGEIA